MDIENRSKSLAAGFVKQAAFSWKQPIGTYLGGATSGGLIGGLIGSGIGGTVKAIRSAKAAQPGLGNKIKAGLKGGLKGGIRGGLIGAGVGTGLGALQTPFGALTEEKLERDWIVEDLKDILAGKTLEDDCITYYYPELMNSLTNISKSEGVEAAIESLNKIKDLRSQGQFSPIANFWRGMLFPVAYASI